MSIISASLYEAERYLTHENAYVVEVTRPFRDHGTLNIVECVDLDDANEMANAMLTDAPRDVFLVAVRPATIEDDAEWVAEELYENR